MISNRQFLRCFGVFSQFKWAFAKVSQIPNRQLSARLEMASIPHKTKAECGF